MSLLGFIGGGGGQLGDMAFNAWSANKQMKFQEDMSSTQYQRAAKDLEAAGLNRVLALGNPASSPGGAMATSSGSSQAVSQGSTARSLIRMQDEQAELLRRQQIKTDAETDNIRSQTPNLPLTGENIVSGTDYNRQQIENLKQLIPKIAAETRSATAQAGKDEFTKETYERLTPVLNAVLDRLIPSKNSSGKAVGGAYDAAVDKLSDFFTKILPGPKVTPAISPNKPAPQPIKRSLEQRVRNQQESFWSPRPNYRRGGKK